MQFQLPSSFFILFPFFFFFFFSFCVHICVSLFLFLIFISHHRYTDFRSWRFLLPCKFRRDGNLFFQCLMIMGKIWTFISPSPFYPTSVAVLSHISTRELIRVESTSPLENSAIYSLPPPLSFVLSLTFPHCAIGFERYLSMPILYIHKFNVLLHFVLW